MNFQRQLPIGNVGIRYEACDVMNEVAALSGEDAARLLHVVP